jgi:hypothetical protein
VIPPPIPSLGDAKSYGDYFDRNVDWKKVCKMANLDFEEERYFTITKLLGLSRDSVMSQAKDDKQRKTFQAAARRLSRKMPRIAEIVRGQKMPK